ncbi:hypothetical protein WMY93_002695 [Mugilogobius chulae]|uniref:Tetraspanin n=1 Tax=Mugilogobius chulae TaxID=88201 RepID=A0AAW0PXB2_9GOBI
MPVLLQPPLLGSVLSLTHSSPRCAVDVSWREDYTVSCGLGPSWWSPGAYARLIYGQICPRTPGYEQEEGEVSGFVSVVCGEFFHLIETFQVLVAIIMALDGCGVVCKYIIILFDVVFAVLGIGFLGLGLWLRFSNNTKIIFEIQELNSSAFVIGVTVMIILGAVMLIVVTFGDYGACSEKRCALQVFSCLVAILAGAEIIIGVLAYTNRDEVGTRMTEFYTSLYGVYMATKDPAIAVVLQFLQKMLHCCGLSGIVPLEFIKQTCPAPDGFLEHFKMDSCVVTITDIFHTKASLVMGLFVGTGALLITTLICSSILAKKIHVAAVSPQYIILSSSPSSSIPQQAFLSPYPSLPPDQEPVVFTPLSAANIPIAQH